MTPRPSPRPWTPMFTFTGGDDDGSLFERHPGLFAMTVIAVVLAAMIGLAFLVTSGSHEPGLVYAPQVVHRTITTTDGRTIDCAVSHSGMSCDW